MKLIPVGKHHFSQVDDSDYDLLIGRRWSLMKNAWTQYAATKCTKEEVAAGSTQHTSIHRLLMGSPKGMFVDHIDHDGLNNQRSNLRICTPAQNMMNMKRKVPTKSGVKGVAVTHRNGYTYFQARLRKGRKWVFLKNFKTLEEAALAYNEAAIKHFGDFAYLNFINLKP